MLILFFILYYQVLQRSYLFQMLSGIRTDTILFFSAAFSSQGKDRPCHTMRKQYGLLSVRLLYCPHVFSVDANDFYEWFPFVAVYEAKSSNSF